MTSASPSPKRQPQTTLDATDRKLLALLAEDATRTYAELGRLLHLSAPAVHERAKRLKQDGVVKATVAALDGARLGRPLLAFVHVDTASWAVTRQLLQLSDPNRSSTSLQGKMSWCRSSTHSISKTEPRPTPQYTIGLPRHIFLTLTRHESSPRSPALASATRLYLLRQKMTRRIHS